MRALLFPVAFAIVSVAAGCGFDCKVQEETEHFNDCDALQSRIDEVQDEPNPDNAVLDDLLTCGGAAGCQVSP